MASERKLHTWWWWSTEERQKFRRRLRRASPYILILLLPGSFVLLPLYALWRRWWKSRNQPPAAESSPVPLPERLPD